MVRNRKGAIESNAPAPEPLWSGEGLPPRRVRHGFRRKKGSAAAVGALLFVLTGVGIVAYEVYEAVSRSQTVHVSVSVPAGTAPLSAGPPTASPAPQQAAPAQQPNTSGSLGTSASGAAYTGERNQIAATQAKGVNKAPSAPAAPARKQPKAPKVVRHVVRKGETLIQLSRRYYGHEHGVSRIARYNGLDPDAPLPIGRVVYIPLG